MLRAFFDIDHDRDGDARTTGLTGTRLIRAIPDEVAGLNAILLRHDQATS